MSQNVIGRVKFVILPWHSVFLSTLFQLHFHVNVFYFVKSFGLETNFLVVFIELWSNHSQVELL